MSSGSIPNGDAEILKKADMLLQTCNGEHVSHREERLLVVLVLMTRIHEPANIPGHIQEQILSFCQRIVGNNSGKTVLQKDGSGSSSKETGDSSSGPTKQQQQHQPPPVDVLVRFAARFLSRILSTPPLVPSLRAATPLSLSTRTRIARLVLSLWSSLLDVLENRLHLFAWETMDLDLCTTLHDCLDAHYDSDVPLSKQCYQRTVSVVWQRFHKTTTTTTTPAPPPSNSSTDSSTDASPTMKNRYLQQHQQPCNTDEKEWMVMVNTLDALLLLSSDVDGEQPNIPKEVQTTILRLMQRHASMAASANSQEGVVPQWMVSLLAFVEPRRQRQEVRRRLFLLEWQGVALTCVRSLTHRSSMLLSAVDLSSSSLLEQWLVNHPNEAVSLSTLCLAQISNTANTASNDSHSHVQTLAWDTLAILVESCGWEWTMASAPSLNHFPSCSNTDTTEKGNSNLGRAANFCTMLRIAAGEWRIRLGLFLEQLDTKPYMLIIVDRSDKDDGPDDDDPEQQSLLVLEACGRIVLSGLAYVVQLAQELEEDNDYDGAQLPILAEALLHVRHSLRDALDASMEYFVLMESSSEQNSHYRRSSSSVGGDNKRDMDEEHSVVTLGILVSRMFGSLLGEFIQDLLLTTTNTTTNDGNADSLNSALQALRSALICTTTGLDHHQGQSRPLAFSNSSRMMTCLLPCLSTILSTVDKPALKQNDLLGTVLIDAMTSHLMLGSLPSASTFVLSMTGNGSSDNGTVAVGDENEFVSSIAWSCNVLEMWCDLTNPPMKEKRKVIKPLLRFIRHLIGLVQSDKSTRIGVSSVLSLVVGCYMGLLGESRPSSDEEGRLVEKALHCLTSSK